MKIFNYLENEIEIRIESVKIELDSQNEFLQEMINEFERNLLKNRSKITDFVKLKIQSFDIESNKIGKIYYSS